MGFCMELIKSELIKINKNVNMNNNNNNNKIIKLQSNLLSELNLPVNTETIQYKFQKYGNCELASTNIYFQKLLERKNKT
jgi:hypothetical protein